MGWIHNRFHNRLVKVVFELVSTAMVYWFLGPVVFLYAVLMIGDTLKNAQQKGNILSGIGYSACILVLTVAWILLSTQTLQYPMYRIFAGLNYYRYPGAVSPLPFVVMAWAVVIPFLGMIPCRQKSMPVLGGAIIALLLIGIQTAVWGLLKQYGAKHDFPPFHGGTKNWLPTLFAENLGVPMSEAGPMSTITIAVSSLFGVLFGGVLSDKWVHKNIRGRVDRKSVV